MTPEQYATAQGVRDELTRQLADLLRRIDIIALPTTPTAAPRVENAEAMRAAVGPNYTRAFNVTGMPAISVPCGFTRNRCLSASNSPDGRSKNRRCCAPLTRLSCASAVPSSGRRSSRHRGGGGVLVVGADTA